jgi:hypothetical protein
MSLSWLIRAFIFTVAGTLLGFLWFLLWEIKLIWGDDLFIAVLSIPYEGKKTAAFLTNLATGATIGIFAAIFWRS